MVHDNASLEVVKLLSSFATPIVVAVFGILVLRRIEGVKAAVARQSDFQSKWADQFFESCQDFLRAVERELAALTSLCKLPVLEQHDGLGQELQKEISRLHPKIMELELRIRRCVVFAPVAGREVTSAANACIELVSILVNSLKADKQGNVDGIIEQMNVFNTSARRAHAEMLGLGSAEVTAPNTS